MAGDVIGNLRDAVGANRTWREYLERCDASPPDQIGLHLGVFVEPFLRHILDGTKTVEARFSARRCAPFGCVAKGDVLLLKRAGGPVVGMCQVSHVWSYRLDPNSLGEIRRTFSEAMCAQDDDFWSKCHRACYATLLLLEQVQCVAPVPWSKRDRRGWVVLRRKSSQPTLW